MLLQHGLGRGLLRERHALRQLTHGPVCLDEVLKAFFCETRGGRIAKMRHYDAFEPF